MQGDRFFDPVRWGIAADYLNNYFSVEKNRAAQLKDPHFQKGRHEYLPIPINQINYSKGLYKQNNGW
ncbi:MAG TPA: RagB/SusD family nutrient uptake outer membrane protein [Chitinophagaceae bacterium]|nr:RagB/SusD family nutrient uptake outer membrane protein [Chitinophagaceae bacterium]